MTLRPDRFERGRTDADERARIAAGVGAELRQARAGAGLSQRRCAELTGVGRRTIQALEAGERRPRRSLLAALAAVLDPAEPDGLTRRLVTAAGPSLAVESEHSARRRAKRSAAAEIAERQRRQVRVPSGSWARLPRRARRLTARVVQAALRDEHAR